MFSSESKNLPHYFVALKSQNTEAVINNTLKYYVTNAQLYKNIFIVLNIVVLAINCGIPFINQFFREGSAILISFLSCAAAFITGISAFLSFREKWYRYRTAAEKLKSECNIFNSGCGKYAEVPDVSMERYFIECFESINTDDITMWKNEISKIMKENADAKGDSE